MSVSAEIVCKTRSYTNQNIRPITNYPLPAIVTIGNRRVVRDIAIAAAIARIAVPVVYRAITPRAIPTAVTGVVAGVIIIAATVDGGSFLLRKI